MCGSDASYRAAASASATDAAAAATVDEDNDDDDYDEDEDGNQHLQQNCVCLIPRSLEIANGTQRKSIQRKQQKAKAEKVKATDSINQTSGSEIQNKVNNSQDNGSNG